MSELPRLDPQREALRQHVLTHSLKTGNFTLKSDEQVRGFLIRNKRRADQMEFCLLQQLH